MCKRPRVAALIGYLIQVAIQFNLISVAATGECTCFVKSIVRSGGTLGLVKLLVVGWSRMVLCLLKATNLSIRNPEVINLAKTIIGGMYRYLLYNKHN